MHFCKGTNWNLWILNLLHHEYKSCFSHPHLVSFYSERTMTSYVAHHVPFPVALEIENGGWGSDSVVFCDTFGLSVWPSFSIRRWRCSSTYHRPHCWYYGNMCLSRSVCKKAARSMRCLCKSNSVWIEEVLELGFWENCGYFYFIYMELHYVSFLSDWNLFSLWKLSFEGSISIWCWE